MYLPKQRLRPQIVGADRYNPEKAAGMLPEVGLIVVKGVFENELPDFLKGILPGSQPFAQYESVFQKLVDPYTLRLVATDGPAVSTGGTHQSTMIHSDGYQYPAKGKYAHIAGTNTMPHDIVLAYPTVGDERYLFFYQMRSAYELLMPNHRAELALDQFEVANQVCQEKDPDLHSGTTPICYDDGYGLGNGFIVGSKLRGMNYDAAAALDVLMEYARHDMATFIVEPGDVYIQHQHNTSHKGTRTKPKEGQPSTVLIRQLLRHTD